MPSDSDDKSVWGTDLQLIFYADALLYDQKTSYKYAEFYKAYSFFYHFGPTSNIFFPISQSLPAKLAPWFPDEIWTVYRMSSTITNSWPTETFRSIRERMSSSRVPLAPPSTDGITNIRVQSIDKYCIYRQFLISIMLSIVQQKLLV